jgi:hypothetical protein
MAALAKTGVEAAREVGVAVADQEVETRLLLRSLQANWASLLDDPGANRVGGAAGEMDAAAAWLDEEENVEALKRDRLDGEEVDREHAVCLLP